jgi:hypothetical protein
MTLQLIRVNDVTVSVAHLHRVALSQATSEVRVFVAERESPFLFVEESGEKATSLYFNLCHLLEATQAQIPFISFGPTTVQLGLITAIHLQDNAIVVSLKHYAPEVIQFASADEAARVFNELMNSLGMGVKSELDEKSERVIAQDSPTPKTVESPKPPEQVPR